MGGVPRLLKAQELARIMDRNFGFVCYAGVDVDPWMKYPKGENACCIANIYILYVYVYVVSLSTSQT